MADALKFPDFKKIQVVPWLSIATLLSHKSVDLYTDVI